MHITGDMLIIVGSDDDCTVGWIPTPSAPYAAWVEITYISPTGKKIVIEMRPPVAKQLLKALGGALEEEK